MRLEDAERLFGLDEDVQFEREPVTGADVRFARQKSPDELIQFMYKDVKAIVDSLKRASDFLEDLEGWAELHKGLFGEPFMSSLARKARNAQKSIALQRETIQGGYDSLRNVIK